MAERARAKGKKATTKKKAPKGAQASRGKVAKMAKAGSVGHNSQNAGLSDDEVRIEINRLNRLYADWEKANAEAKQVKGVYQSARKAAKKNGLNIDAYTQARDLDRQDHGRVLVDAADAGRYLRIMKSPLALQMDLFQNLEAPPPTVDVALQGQQAGKNAEPASNNPYTPGSDDFNIWAENHALGLKQVADGFRGGATAH